jgi:hypothetical protein
MEGLGPDSAACIRHYKELARDEDLSKVKRFLAGLIEDKKNKYLLLIITSGVSRIRNKNRELEILDYLYRSKRLAIHLRVYANTRSCYLVCDKIDRDLAKTYIARGYESLHLRLACPPSDRSKWDPTHMGFSVMLAMLNVMMVYGWLGEASFFAESAFADAGNIQEGRITKAFYGTTARIAKIVGIYYLLCLRRGNSRECAEQCLSLLRNVFSHGIARADGGLIRYLEFSESLTVYRYILEFLDGGCNIDAFVADLVNVSILANPKAKRRVLRKLGYGANRQGA